MLSKYINNFNMEAVAQRSAKPENKPCEKVIISGAEKPLKSAKAGFMNT
jgi:hypothetical protein